jgi:hypothetical protein
MNKLFVNDKAQTVSTTAKEGHAEYTYLDSDKSNVDILVTYLSDSKKMLVDVNYNTSGKLYDAFEEDNPYLTLKYGNLNKGLTFQVSEVVLREDNAHKLRERVFEELMSYLTKGVTLEVIWGFIKAKRIGVEVINYESSSYYGSYKVYTPDNEFTFTSQKSHPRNSSLKFEQSVIDEALALLKDKLPTLDQIVLKVEEEEKLKTFNKFKDFSYSYKSFEITSLLEDNEMFLTVEDYKLPFTDEESLHEAFEELIRHLVAK